MSLLIGVPLLNSCVMCGAPKSGNCASSKTCSEKCLEEFEQAHSPVLLRQRFKADKWSYYAVGALAGRLRTPIADEATEIEQLRNSLSAFSRLKERLVSLEKDSAGIKKGGVKVQEWIGRFDALIRDLDSALSPDVLEAFVKQTKEFHDLHDDTSKPPATMAQVRNLLNEIVAAIPVAGMPPDQRDLIERILSRKLANRNRMILSIDGGGMRGVVSLYVLMALLKRIRELTGRPNLRLDECFDLMVGTSTGGIIVVGVCVAKRSLEELIELYERLGSSIFGDSGKITAFKPSILARYGDRRLMELLLDVVGTKRLDDSDVTASETRAHFGVTTVDISWKPARPYFLRNYGVEDERGTNRAFVSEAVRCTTAASTFLLPYSRQHGVMSVDYHPWSQSISSRYLLDTETGKFVSNMDFIMKRALVPGDQERLKERMKEDKFMNDSVNVDGGSWACNPTRVAIIEAQRQFSVNGSRPYIHAFNIGTGEMPKIRNTRWNSSEPRPADSPLLGKNGMKVVMTELIMGAFVDPATDTSETNYELKQEYGDSVCIQRINPRLSRHFPLDTVDVPSLKQMIDDTKKWLEGPDGSAAVESWAQDIVNYSEKLKKV